MTYLMRTEKQRSRLITLIIISTGRVMNDLLNENSKTKVKTDKVNYHLYWKGYE